MHAKDFDIIRAKEGKKMLINLTIENFLSFDTPVSFSMQAGRKTSRHENHVRDVGGIPILKGAAIYGANAAGKSNLLKAMDLFLQMIHRGDCSVLRGLQFALAASIRPDMCFDVVYSNGESVFRYAVTTDGLSVKHERLWSICGEKEHILFDRQNGTGLVLGEKLERAEWYRQRTLADNLLYLPKLLSDGLAENRANIAMSDCILSAYLGLTTIYVLGSESRPSPGAFYLFIKRDEFKSFLLDLLKRADLGVTDLSWEPLSGKEAEMIFNMNPFKGDGARVLGISRGFYLIKKDADGISGEEFRLRHNGVPLRAEAESDGTVRLIHLSPMLYQLYKGHGTWFIDEADCHIHPMLMRFLLKSFMERQINDVQLVITMHDTNLMTHDIWRTDEIWFAEKRVDGSSDLYSLYQFQPRHDKNLAKGYLQGLYGALPSLGGEMVYDE